MAKDNWLLQFDSYNRLTEESYVKFIKQLQNLEIYNISNNIENALSLSDNDITFLEAKKLVSLFKETNTLIFSNGNSLKLEDVKFQFEIFKIQFDQFLH